jgi:hypothetical protein
MKPSARVKRQWHVPAITIEMPFRETYNMAGCTSDAANPAPGPGVTFTPVLKSGGGADSEFTACAGAS